MPDNEYTSGSPFETIYTYELYLKQISTAKDCLLEKYSNSYINTGLYKTEFSMHMGQPPTVLLQPAFCKR